MAGVHGLLHENAPNDPCNPSTVLRCHRFSASLVLGFVYAHHLSATYPSRAAKDCCHPLHTGQSDRTERKAPCSKTAAEKISDAATAYAQKQREIIQIHSSQ